MEVISSVTSSSGEIPPSSIETDSQTITIGLFRLNTNVIRLCPIPYDGNEQPSHYERPEVSDFMLRKPA
jgi:hypothetical protein